MDQGWAWDAGVVHGTDPAAFQEDPDDVGRNIRDRFPDAESCKPRRDALLALFKAPLQHHLAAP
jgi:hypothetical protein